MIRAGGDTAWRKNSSALCVLRRHGHTFELVKEREWIPSENPLKPTVVTREMIASIRKSGAEVFCVDYRDIDLIAEYLEDTGVELQPFTTVPGEITQAFTNLKFLLSEDRIDLSIASPRLIEQLEAVTAKPGEGGHMQISQPKKGASHGDIVSALICALYAFDLGDISEGMYGGSRRFQRGEEDEQGRMRMYPKHDEDEIADY